MYEMVDMSSQNYEKSSQESHRKYSQTLTSHDTSKQEQTQKYQVLDGQDGTKPGENINVRDGPGDQSHARVLVVKSSEEENAYQPLIPPRSVIGNESREYQLLTLPKQLNVAPSLPPKPGTNRTVKRAQISVQHGWKDNY